MGRVDVGGYLQGEGAIYMEERGGGNLQGRGIYPSGFYLSGRVFFSAISAITFPRRLPDTAYRRLAPSPCTDDKFTAAGASRSNATVVR